MTEGQDLTHIRGDDLQIPVTVTLDEARTLDGDETWNWVLKREIGSPVSLSKGTTPGTGITVDGSSFQPTIVLTDTDFPTSSFPSSIVNQVYIHELQMTKSAKIETILRGKFTLKSDVVI
jgi:hypothetical protein